MRKRNSKNKLYILINFILLLLFFSSCSGLFNSQKRDGETKNRLDQENKVGKGGSDRLNVMDKEKKKHEEGQGGYPRSLGMDLAKQEEIFARIFKQIDFSKSFNGRYDSKAFRKLLIKAKNNFSISKISNLSREDYLEELRLLKRYIPEAGEIIDNFDKLDLKIVDSLLKYPENFLWAYSFLNKEARGDDGPSSLSTSSKGIILTDEEKAETIPYLSQVDLRWGLKEYGRSFFGRSGCGPTVMSMLVVGLTRDYDQNPYEVGKFARENGYYLDNMGTEWSFFSQGAKHYGLKSKNIKFEKKEIISELNAGNYLVLNVKKGDFTYSGHYIIICGYDGNEFKIHDPNSWINTSKSWTFDRLKGQVKAVWSIGK